jgi:hypothetical protein
MSEWQLSEAFSEKIELEGLCGYLHGITATHLSGLEISGSSFDLLKAEAESRARAELAERMLTVLRTAPSVAPGAALARSNGWAAHPDVAQSKSSAFFELLERHRILHFWYSGRRPEHVPLLPTASWLPEGLANRMKLFRFPADDDYEVCMCVIWPEAKTGPRFAVTGFAAGDDLTKVSLRSMKEAIQRWAFLYDETPESDWQNLPPSALYQQEFGISEPGQNLLKKWLTEGLSTLSIPHPLALELSKANYEIETYQIHGVPYTVAKCLHSDALPLVFGPQAKSLLPWLPDTSERWIHPIA